MTKRKEKTCEISLLFLYFLLFKRWDRVLDHVEGDNVHRLNEVLKSEDVVFQHINTEKKEKRKREKRRKREILAKQLGKTGRTEEEKNNVMNE